MTARLRGYGVLALWGCGGLLSSGALWSDRAHAEEARAHSAQDRSDFDTAYRVISTEADSLGSLRRTTWTVQQGQSTLNRFRLVRLKRDEPGEQGHRRARHRRHAKHSRSEPLHPLGQRQAPPIILLSPFGFPVEYWLIADDGEEDGGFASQLALEGHDVWLVDSRLAAAEPGECESGVVDCSVLADWGMQTAVEDALFVRRLVQTTNPFARPIVGGLSGGSSAALAAVNARPQLFSGLFLWEGTLLSFDPDIQARNATFCELDRAAIEAGDVYDASVQGFQTLFQLATIAPKDPTPIPVFPPNTSNLGALLFVLTQPDPSNPLNFTESFVRFVGDPFAETLAHADLDRVIELGPLIGNYAPLAFVRDSHCSIGGLDTSFTDRLGAFRGRALIFAEGGGFDQMMLDTGVALEHAVVTVDYQPDFGESDRMFHLDWQSVALDPLLQWLEKD